MFWQRIYDPSPAYREFPCFKKEESKEMKHPSPLIGTSVFLMEYIVLKNCVAYFLYLSLTLFHFSLSNMKHLLFIILLLSLTCSRIYADSGLRFSSIPVLDKLPTNYIRCLYQDKEGSVWIGTPHGLFMYNGYKAIPIRTDTDGYALPDNEILCITEDDHHRLWVGTRTGLSMIDKMTWNTSCIDHEAFKNVSVQQLLLTSKGELWVGTEAGVCYYDSLKQSFCLFDGKEGRAFCPKVSVIALYEDKHGNIWIGTWADGLLRYDRKTNQFHSYPGLWEKRNVSAIHMDKQNRMWVGVWGEGLILLENPYQKPQAPPRHFEYNPSNEKGICDNYIYAIAEDEHSGNLWFGTRSGLSILHESGGLLSFENYLAGELGKTISYNEIYAITCDREGNMWLGMYGGGVNFVDARRKQIKPNLFEPEIKGKNTSHTVQSILVDDDNLLWLGSGSKGIMIRDRKTGKPYRNKDMEKLFALETNISCIMQSPANGKIWLGTYGKGVWIYDKKASEGQRLTEWDWHFNSWIGSMVNDILEDSQGNCWFATNTGLSMLDSQGKKHSFASRNLNGKRGNTYRFCQAMEDSRKRIWLASDNNGIVRIDGHATDTVPDMTFYLPHNKKLSTSVISCVYEDKRHRVWAGSGIEGLFLYEEGTDRFISVEEQFGLPGEAISSIEEDNEGNLWLGTNAGLVKLIVPEDLSKATYYLYTGSDGLQGNIFNRNASFKTSAGELFFGGNNGYNSFFPNQLKNEVRQFPVVITDIKIFDSSWRVLDKSTREKISPSAPEFARKITLNDKQSNFSIEFTTLKFAGLDDVQYAYLLKGVDPAWVHTDGTRPFAYYNHLKPGKYTFYLKASTGNGGWTATPLTLEVCILPPPWKTGWAYTLYILAATLAAFVTFRSVRNRMALRNEIRLRKMENEKLEELNHAKLQFFTNITHELLTPLAIISAAIDHQKQGVSKMDYSNTIADNVNRLIRLIQQILEFRKAETGHLKLKVSHGNLALFLRNCVDSIRPFAEKKKIEISFECNDEVLPAYFDPDKVDKMVYNLLSNAIKYNKFGGLVRVTLEQRTEKEQIKLTVTDNGLGITPEQQQKLFSFFYEGDYRRFNTTGTGIGLALTKNLVNLHRGTIRVESEVDKGTSFEIVLPIHVGAFDKEEVDNELIIPSVPLPAEFSVAHEEDAIESLTEEKEKKYSILVVEDEVELLCLMKSLLETYYVIFTAETGKQGLEVLKENDIDLIISDIMMPEMDGIEFCKTIKGDVEACDIPVILLTAKNQQKDQIEAYDSGANAFISKPFNLSVLYSRINNLLKAREQKNRDFKKQFVFEAKELNYTSIDEDFLERAFSCINQHLDDSDYSQNDFIRDMAVSRTTSFRKLKSLTGLTYTDFVKNVRLKAACRIMEEKKNVRVSELAYAVGFNDPKYFSACFKKEFGMTPKEYFTDIG